jgi:hypothetical protein
MGRKGAAANLRRDKAESMEDRKLAKREGRKGRFTFRHEVEQVL